MATIDLYRLVIGDRVWTLTSADEDQVHAGELYVATPLGRSGIQVKNELTKASLEIRLPLGHELSVMLLSSWVERVAVLTVFRKRAGSTDTIWKGRLASTPPTEDSLKLVFESIFTSMRRTGLRARMQKSCRHPLYGRGCWLDPEAFAFAATVSDIAGRFLAVPEAADRPNGFFAGGMVRAPDNTLTYVTSHNGTQIVMNRASRSLLLPFATEGAGMAVTLYPGCAHTYAECAGKFANDLNYGGFDYIPSKNPTGGSSIL